MAHGSFEQKAPRKLHGILTRSLSLAFASALIPTNIYHYAARTGTFVMLVLGF
jgi:hypothetical protein